MTINKCQALGRFCFWHARPMPAGGLWHRGDVARGLLAMLSKHLRCKAHTCAGIAFGGSCFAFCEAGYAAQGVRSERWQCAGEDVTEELGELRGSDSGSVVPGLSEVDGVALRGTMPTCSPQACGCEA